MLDIFLKFDFLGQIIQISINAHAHIPALFCTVKHFGMFALSAAHHRRQQLQLCALRQLHNLIHHLVYGLALDFPAAVWTVWYPYARIQKPEIIIDFSHRSDG